MNDRNKIKLPKKVNHYPVDTHLSKCCLRECPMKNVKGKEIELGSCASSQKNSTKALSKYLSAPFLNSTIKLLLNDIPPFLLT